MRVIVVGLWGKLFDEVEVEVDLPASYSFDDLVAAMPTAAASASAGRPGGRFEGMQLAGDRRSWTIEGRGAGGRLWREDVEAICEVEAAFQGAFAALDGSRSVHPSDLKAFMEALKRQAIVSVSPEPVAGMRPAR